MIGNHDFLKKRKYFQQQNPQKIEGFCFEIKKEKTKKKKEKKIKSEIKFEIRNLKKKGDYDGSPRKHKNKKGCKQIYP